MTTADRAVSQAAATVAVQAIQLMPAGDRAGFEALFHPEAANHEAAVAPPAARVPGPEGFHQLALWLRSAFDDLRYDIEHVVADGDLVALRNVYSGRHVGPFVLHNAEGAVETVFPPTGRTFAVHQTHWLRIADGQVIDHWADRDDMGHAQQAGWIPPTPVFLMRMAWAKRRAVRTQRTSGNRRSRN